MVGVSLGVVSEKLNEPISIPHDLPLYKWTCQRRHNKRTKKDVRGEKSIDCDKAAHTAEPHTKQHLSDLSTLLSPEYFNLGAFERDI